MHLSPCSMTNFGMKYSDIRRTPPDFQKPTGYDYRQDAIDDLRRENQQEVSANTRRNAAGGAVVGSILFAAIGGMFASAYKDAKSKEVIQDLKEEYLQEDTKKDALEIRDLNSDETPEFILEKTDGTKVIYDIKNGKVQYQIDNEIIDKI